TGMFGEGEPRGVQSRLLIRPGLDVEVHTEFHDAVRVTPTPVDAPGALCDRLHRRQLAHPAIEVQAQRDFEDLGGDDQATPTLSPAFVPLRVARPNAPLDRRPILVAKP